MSSDGQSQGSSTINARDDQIVYRPLNETTYTSFSDLLGATLPPSFDGNGTSNNTSSSPLRRISSSLKKLLHPTYCLEEESEPRQVDVSERTPLIEAEQRRRQRRAKLSKRYVGGSNAFSAITEDTGSETDIGETPLAICRQCEASDSPIPPYRLAVISQLLFAIMSLLAEIMARGSHKHRLDEMLLVSIQSSLLCVVSTSILLLTGTKNAFLGPPDVRWWMWARAACASISTILFILASQSIPTMNLVIIVYVAPLVFNLLSTIFTSINFPFRAQLVSLSLLLGLTLVIQPTIIFPDNDHYQTIPAAPIDLPPIGDYRMAIPEAWGYVAATFSSLFMVLSFILLSRAIKISIYHSIASNSALTAILSFSIFIASGSRGVIQLPSFKYFSLLFAIIVVSLLAHLFQGIAFRQKSPRQLSLVTFLQPVFTTTLQTIFLDRSLDVLPLAGSILIAANIAWISSPLTIEEEDEEEW